MDSIEILDVFRHYNIRVIYDGSGRSRCNCPFHRDRTPSLKVYPQTNTWYAYCCSKGITVWDFIREKEGGYWQAEKVLKELATIDLPEDPLEDLVNELKEKTKEESRQKVEAVAYLIGISLRDFLGSKRETEMYEKLCEEVNDWFKRIDELLEFEDVEESEMRVLEKQVQEYILQRRK